MQTESTAKILLLCMLTALVLSNGCDFTEGVFTKPELRRYSRFAVLGLEPRKDQIFMAYYMNTFPEQNITFVERANLAEILTEQDMLEERLDNDTRARIRRILGIEALILCHDDLADSRLRVRILDSETGTIVGSAIAFSYIFDDRARLVTAALKANLQGL